MFTGRLRGCPQPITQSEIATELNGSGLGIEKAVRTAFDRETVAVVGPHCPADMIRRFQDGHVGVGSQSLQSIRETQAADAGTDDNDTWHVRFTGCALSSPRSGRG